MIRDEEHRIFTFPNGIRLVHKQVPYSGIAHCGITADTGSRDEQDREHGIAHFREHMAFKGTHSRSAFRILNRLDAVGGDLNAFTTKEKTCFHASVLTEHFDKAAELLTDIVFHSVFPEKEIEKERNVILEEMAMYADMPEDSIHDDFEALVFPNHPLGRNVLGTPKTVNAIGRQDIFNFLSRNIDTEKMVFSSVSSLPFEKVLKTVSRFLADIPATRAERLRESPAVYEAQNITLKKDGITQVHCMIGAPAYSVHDLRRLPFFMLVNMLGGPANTAVLNMLLREKKGYAYSVEAGFSPLTDSGNFYIYFGTEKKYAGICRDLIFKELKKTCENTVGNLTFHRAKNQLKGQLAMSEENYGGLMLMMGKSLADLDRIDTLPEIFAQIDAVKPGDLTEVARDVFRESNLSVITYLPNQ